jgi:hypothetical protein
MEQGCMVDTIHVSLSAEDLLQYVNYISTVCLFSDIIQPVMSQRNNPFGSFAKHRSLIPHLHSQNMVLDSYSNRMYFEFTIHACRVPRLFLLDRFRLNPPGGWDPLQVQPDATGSTH